MNNRWYNDELYHYGVLGMKWGQRKKPDLNNGEFTRKDYRYAVKQFKKNKKKGIDFKNGKNYIKAENRMVAELNRTYNQKNIRLRKKTSMMMTLGHTNGRFQKKPLNMYTRQCCWI